MPSQQNYNYTNKNRLLYIPVGSHISLQYQENRHVTQPHVPPAHKTPGMTYVYGTNQSRSEDKLLSIYKWWTSDGSGGDRRDRLIGEGPFDDNQCYQAQSNFSTNPSNTIYRDRRQRFGPDIYHGDNRWCQGVATMPVDIGIRIYTLYWVWDYSTIETESVYTTCMDIIIED